MFLISLLIMINQAFKIYIKKDLIQYTKSYKDKQGLYRPIINAVTLFFTQTKIKLSIQ